MYYRNMTNEELKKYPYPNLLAELIESGYSICTLGDHMGLGRYLPEDSLEVWDRLCGKVEMSAKEMLVLSRLFSVNMEYLFSHQLKLIGEETFAYVRWYDWNQKKKQDMLQFQQRERISRCLRSRPYLGDVIEAITKMEPDEVQRLSDYLRCMKVGVAV